MSIIKHSLPGIGRTEIHLYPPAINLHRRLRNCGEIERQNQLRHLGVLTHAHPGTRLARWDYTVAMLHYTGRLSKLVGANHFSLNGIEFSSSVAAIQSLSLAWNLGHLPGTYAVEKGVHAFMRSKNDREPMSLFAMPHPEEAAAQRFFGEANEFLAREDYLGMSRVLAVLKLLRLATSKEDLEFQLALNFYWPIVAQVETVPSVRWERLRRMFRVVRHLAYLTLDTPFTGLQWVPPIPALVDQLVTRAGGDFENFISEASEILSPVERATSATIYHSDDARLETARIARAVVERLGRCDDAPTQILRWLRSGLLRHLALGRTRTRLNHIGSIRLRSHFHSVGSPVDLENRLRVAGFSHPLVSRYVAWNSDALFEPNENIIDTFGEERTSGNQVGRLISFLIERFDSPVRSQDEYLRLLIRRDLRASYAQLLERVIAAMLPGAILRLEPWNLGALGVRVVDGQTPSDTGIVTSDRLLNDEATKRALRRPRVTDVPAAWQHQVSELDGVRKLRTRLRDSWSGAVPRRRWLLVLSSVRLTKDGNDLIEFDGGILEISTRSGRLTWWGLETKRGHANPERSLKRRLNALGIVADVIRMGKRHAVAKVVIP